MQVTVTGHPRRIHHRRAWVAFDSGGSEDLADLGGVLQDVQWPAADDHSALHAVVSLGRFAGLDPSVNDVAKRRIEFRQPFMITADELAEMRATSTEAGTRSTPRQQPRACH